MPTAIPQVPPPQQSKELHQSKATVRGKKEDSFREVLDGAKKQVRPKQREPKAPEPAVEKAAEAPAVDDEAWVDAEAEAGTEEVVEKRPAARRKEKPQKSEGSDVAEPARTGEAAVLTAAVPFEVPVDLTILDDAGVETEAEPEADSAPLSDLSIPDEQLLACTSNICVQPMETTEATTGRSDAQVAGLGLPMSPITGASAETPDRVSPASDGAAVPAEVSSVGIPLEAVTAETEELPVPMSGTGVRPPEESADVGESIAPEDLPVVSRDMSLPQEQSAGNEQPADERDASNGESSQEQAVARIATSFSATLVENDPAQATDPTTVAAPVKSEQAPVIKAVVPPAAPIADPLEARFAEANHPRIVTAVQAELMASGGTVRLRLDPPELGALQVRIDVKDGVLAASFQTSNDEATRLLTRSLQQLKTTLESHGVTVEKLHVQQTPREQWDGGRNGEDRQHQSPQHWQQQEQQRREMLQRMWRRVRDGRDPFDLVA